MTFIIKMFLNSPAVRQIITLIGPLFYTFAFTTPYITITRRTHCSMIRNSSPTYFFRSCTTNRSNSIQRFLVRSRLIGIYGDANALHRRWVLYISRTEKTADCATDAKKEYFAILCVQCCARCSAVRDNYASFQRLLQ